MPLTSKAPDPVQVGRFRDALTALAVPAGAPLGVAVSGGPDSLALLLLAHAAHDGPVAAATVDHGLRPAAEAEAEAVAALCRALAVDHAILRVTVEPAGTGIQAAARTARYRALADWCAGGAIATLATAHHADDQAETLLMRLNRGAGLAGLAGVRAERPLAPGLRLVRPLLGWRKAELAALVAAQGIVAADDPSNHDDRHDRTAMRALLAANPLLDPVRIAASAHHLADSESALAWAAADILARRISRTGDAVTLDPVDLPGEILRRAVTGILSEFNHVPDGPSVATLVARLRGGQAATLGGVKATPGARWHFAPAPPRRGG
ncbi:tRNA lysidine(34) synthetase TilS [Sphingomonas flavalba]|uniref:tRNA lysidine(34) synthetase TilS n=1 Tax=Sphingomonas flavalba TaxID=2559804 RepID=UPI00109E01D6|nr:tRNA lysidine(34) synthetase TilS [Sphingomonas flavalba]